MRYREIRRAEDEGLIGYLSITRRLFEEFMNLFETGEGRAFVIDSAYAYYLPWKDRDREPLYLELPQGVRLTLGYYKLKGRLKRVMGTEVFEVEEWGPAELPSIRFYLSFRDAVNRLLDGVEISSSRLEDMAGLLIVSSPPLEMQAGGIHAGLSGNRTAGFAKRLRMYVLRNLKRLWSFYESTPERYSSRLWRRRTTLGWEYSVGVRADVDNVFRTPVDYPLLLARGPSVYQVSKEGVDLDLLDYVYAIKIRSPHLPENLQDQLSRLSLAVREAIMNMGLSRLLVGKGKLIDPDYTGTPISILRVAQAIVRAEGASEIRQEHLKKAKDKVLQAISYAASELERRPRLVIRPRGLEEEVLNIIKMLENREGVARLEDIRLMLVINPVDLDHILESLRLKGLIFSPKPDTYMTL